MGAWGRDGEKTVQATAVPFGGNSIPSYTESVTGPKSTRNPGVKVFVVDDCPVVLQVLHEWLAAAGYSVETREQALGTASWIAAEKPDFVILDVSMPALQGNELALLLRRHPNTSHVAVVLHSAMELDALSELARGTGAVGAIQKTSSERSFVAQFDRIVARQRLRTARA